MGIVADVGTRIGGADFDVGLAVGIVGAVGVGVGVARLMLEHLFRRLGRQL